MSSKRTLFKRVHAKLMVSFITVAVIPVLIMGHFSEQASTAALFQLATEAQKIRAYSSIQRINKSIENSKNSLLYLARSASITNFLASVNTSSEAEINKTKIILEQEMLRLASSYNSQFAQIRYIDKTGQEQIRIEQKDKVHRLVASFNLQDKSHTEYFNQSYWLDAGSIFVSPVNLNREHKKIAAPKTPVLRLATPVFNSDGKAAGIVVVNINVGSFLGHLGNDLLVSHDGYFIYHPDADKRWGAPRDQGNGKGYKTQNSTDWNRVASQTRGTIFKDGSKYLSSFTKFKIPGAVENWHLITRNHQAVIVASTSETQNQLYTGLGLSLLATIVLASIIGRSITNPLNKLISVVKLVAKGNEQVRANISSHDEFEELGTAFDHMVEERISMLHRAEKENEALNDSIIELMDATSKLAENDLTIKIVVREDITGVVADGLNKMVSESAKILNGIKNVSQEVQHAAELVKKQSDQVTEVASNERALVKETQSSLNKSAKAMTDIADVAQSCNNLAELATISTEKALATVNNTVAGMNDIRETISETEKRIKRLGERSQEITSIVEIINSIAERTHVLALNASMHAAAAGESGRGFAIVADEVQRLSENSRESTSHIATLVHSIQTETSATMATMNKSISQVVAGSKLAEESGRQMQETQANTKELVAVVETIARRSAEQARYSEVLRESATGIQKSTEITGQELCEQSKQTVKLVAFAQRLKDAVDVFTLPQAS